MKPYVVKVEKFRYEWRKYFPFFSHFGLVFVVFLLFIDLISIAFSGCLACSHNMDQGALRHVCYPHKQCLYSNDFSSYLSKHMTYAEWGGKGSLLQVLHWGACDETAV